MTCFGSVGTGFGPVGGATSAFGSDSSFPTSLSGGGSSFDFGSTLNANLLLSGVGHILEGTGELLQAAALNGGYSPLDTGTGTTAGNDTGGTTNTLTGSASDDMSMYGYQGLGGDGSANGGGLDGLLQSMGGNQGTGDLDSMLAELYKMMGVGGQDQAPAQDPLAQFQPQPDPVANLVDRANVDPALKPTVTQIAQDPVGNRLLQGAVDGGLAGIQVRDLPDGFFGQYLPGTGEVQIDQATAQGNDLVRTITHELVHAGTPRDGDSVREENLADQIGTEVQRRITGFDPGYVLGGESYNTLPQDNGIINSLLQLGITFTG